MDRAKARRRGLILGGLAAGAAVGLAAERYLVGRDRRRPDPEARENFGELHGRDVGPLESFDGTRLHVEVVDGDGPTIVMAHGFSLDSTQWHYQIRDLAPAFRLVIYDHRGHGRSEKARRGDWSLDALARDMEAVIREHGGPGPVALLGHSMGGMTVLRFAKLFPEQIGSRVAAVVLVNTTAADVMGGMLPGAARRFAAGFQMVQEGLVRALSSNAGRVDRLRGRTRDLAYLSVRYAGLGPKAMPSVVEFVDGMLSGTPTDVWAKLLPELLAMDVSEVLDVIDVPTLVVAGTHDKLTPPGAADRIAAAIKGAELVVISDAGHMSFLERPQSFNARLRAFLGGVPAFRLGVPRRAG
jgi:pimeloyl-ACP methyl ester carboxylesterase